MEDHVRTNIAFHRFTWTIQDFSGRITKELRSQSFEVGDCRWYVLGEFLCILSMHVQVSFRLFLKLQRGLFLFSTLIRRIVVNQVERNRAQYLLVILKVAKSLLPWRWRKFARIKLILVNQTDPNMSIIKETEQKFNVGYKAWGTPFVHLSEFYNPTRGYLMNNTCIIEAELYISDDPFNLQDNTTRTQDFGQTHESPTQLGCQGIDSCSDETLSFRSLESTWNHASQTNPELQEMEDQGSAEPDEEVPLLLSSSRALGEIMDLTSLEAEELAFVPLLEEVCSWKPSLIESQRGRTSRFMRWAFIALGQILYFLKTTKVGNMGDESARRKLQCLWEEVQTFGFDLTWLEGHVQSALAMKAYLERAEQVRLLKEEVAGLEIEMKKLRADLAVVEVDLDLEKGHLVEEEKGFEEIDMDAQLGYGLFSIVS